MTFFIVQPWQQRAAIDTALRAAGWKAGCITRGTTYYRSASQPGVRLVVRHT